MAYAQGDSILDDHYNIFATGNAAGSGDHSVANINTIWGSGDGVNKGYGQSTTLSSVSAGSSITATQWATLFTRLTSIANHQGTTITALSNPSAGDSIDYKSTLDANLTSCFNNRHIATASGTDITTSGTRTGTGIWYTETLVTYTVTFSSNNHARYFFNAGGMIRISSSRSGGTSNDKNTEWTDLCGDIGTICITSGMGNTIAGTAYTGTDRIGGAGATPTVNDNYGFYDSTTTETEIFKQYADTAPYTSNYIRMTMSDNGSGVITIKVKYRDDAADTTSDYYGAQTHDQVDGSLSTVMALRQPSTTYISNTWGTPTMSTTISQT